MYTLRKQSKAKRTKVLRGLAFVGLMMALSVLVAPGLKHVFVNAAPEDTASVEAVSPVNNATINGDVTLRFTVHGLAPGSYEPFWSVDNGTWSRMSADPNDANTAISTINVKDWKWNNDGRYAITFTALIKGSWRPVQTTVTVNVGAAAVASSALRAPAAASASGLGLLSSSASTNAEMLFADPTNGIAKQAVALAASMPGDAARLQRLANQPVAEWFGNWNNNIQADAGRYVSAAAVVNKIPVLVAYNVPNRDCGGYSAGGAADTQAYLNWVRSMAAGIGNRRAMVIVEPDAVANIDCLSSADQQNRLQLLAQAVAIFKSGSRTSVYLDAGHPNWISAAEMAHRLQKANLAQADGFSLNVSNFIATADNITFGTQISRLAGSKHFVIDTSRNGNGAASNDQWCNPAGRAVGQTPTLQTGNPLVDGYLWVKGPGASDGTCGADVDNTSAPVAGAWWPQYALELLRNAGW